MTAPRYIERHGYVNGWNPASTLPYEEQIKCARCLLPESSEAHHIIESAEDYQKRIGVDTRKPSWVLPEPHWRLMGTELPQTVRRLHRAWHADNPGRDCQYPDQWQ